MENHKHPPPFAQKNMHTLNPTTVRQKFLFLKGKTIQEKMLASPFDLSLFVIASPLYPHYILYVLPCLLKVFPQRSPYESL